MLAIPADTELIILRGGRMGERVHTRRPRPPAVWARPPAGSACQRDDRKVTGRQSGLPVPMKQGPGNEMYKTASGKSRLNLNFLSYLRFNDIKLWFAIHEGKKIKTLHYFTIKEIKHCLFALYNVWQYKEDHEISLLKVEFPCRMSQGMLRVKMILFSVTLKAHTARIRGPKIGIRTFLVLVLNTLVLMR